MAAGVLDQHAGVCEYVMKGQALILTRASDQMTVGAPYMVSSISNTADGVHNQCYQVHCWELLYDVRHAFATSALASGADMKAVSEILGHSRPDTTMRVYQHVDAIQHKAAIDRLPDPSTWCNTFKDCFFAE